MHASSMDTDPLIPTVQTVKPPRTKAKGRPVDLMAAIMAMIAALVSICMMIVFFLGFAENDSLPMGLLSAFALSALLGSFAIGPALYIAHLAFKAWKEGAGRKSAQRVFLLSLPWVILSGVLIVQTPLPLALTLAICVFASLLCLWSIASFFLASSRNIDET